MHANIQLSTYCFGRLYSISYAYIVGFMNCLMDGLVTRLFLLHSDIAQQIFQPFSHSVFGWDRGTLPRLVRRRPSGWIVRVLSDGRISPGGTTMASVWVANVRSFRPRFIVPVSHFEVGHGRRSAWVACGDQENNDPCPMQQASKHVVSTSCESVMLGLPAFFYHSRSVGGVEF